MKAFLKLRIVLAGIPLINDVLNGIDHDVMKSIYQFCLVLAQFFWLFDKMILVVAYLVMSLRYWLAYNLFAPVITVTAVTLAGAFSWEVFVAISILGITYFLRVFTKIRIVELKSVLLWLVVGTAFFNGSGVLYYGFETTRVAIGTFFYQETVGGILCGTLGTTKAQTSGQCGGVGVGGSATTGVTAIFGGLSDSSSFRMGTLCDNFGPYIRSFDPAYTWALSGMDVAMAYFRADPIDVIGSPATLPQSPGGQFCDGMALEHANAMNFAERVDQTRLGVPYSWTTNTVPSSAMFGSNPLPPGKMIIANDDTGVSPESTFYMQPACNALPPTAPGAQEGIIDSAKDVYVGGYFNWIKAPQWRYSDKTGQVDQPWFWGQQCNGQPLPYDTGSAMRAESVQQAFAGWLRAQFGMPLASFSLMEQITYLLLSASLFLAFLLFYVAIFFAMFQKTEPIAMAMVEQFIGIVVMTTALSIISAVVVGFYALAATQGAAVVAIGLGVFAGLFGLMMVATSAKVLLGAADSVFTAIGKATGVSGFGLTDMAKLGAGIATGGAGLAIGAAAGAATVGSIMGNDDLSGGQKAASIGGALMGGNQSLVGAARMLGRLPGMDETGFGQFANDFAAAGELTAVGGALGMGRASSLLVAMPAFADAQASIGVDRAMQNEQKTDRRAAWLSSREDGNDAYHDSSQFWAQSATSLGGEKGPKALGRFEPDWNQSPGGETYSWTGENGVAQTISRRNGTDAGAALTANDTAIDQSFLSPASRGLSADPASAEDEMEAAFLAADAYMTPAKGGSGSPGMTGGAENNSATSGAALAAGGAEAGAAIARGAATLAEVALRLGSNVSGGNFASPQGMVGTMTYGTNDLGGRSTNNAAAVLGGAYQNMVSQGVAQKDGSFSIRQTEDAVLREGGMKKVNDGQAAIQGGALQVAAVMNDANKLGLSGAQVAGAFAEVHDSPGRRLSPETRDRFTEQASRDPEVGPQKAQQMVLQLEADLSRLPNLIKIHGSMDGQSPLTAAPPPQPPPPPPPPAPFTPSPSPIGGNSGNSASGGSDAMKGSAFATGTGGQASAQMLAGQAYQGASREMGTSGDTFMAAVRDVNGGGAISPQTRQAISADAALAGKSQQVAAYTPQLEQDLVRYTAVARSESAVPNVPAPAARNAAPPVDQARTGGASGSANSADPSNSSLRGSEAAEGRSELPSSRTKTSGPWVVEAYRELQQGIALSSSEAVTDVVPKGMEKQAALVLDQASRYGLSPELLGSVMRELDTPNADGLREVSRETRDQVRVSVLNAMAADPAISGAKHPAVESRLATNQLIDDVEELMSAEPAAISPAERIAADALRGISTSAAPAPDSAAERIAANAVMAVQVEETARRGMAALKAEPVLGGPASAAVQDPGAGVPSVISGEAVNAARTGSAESAPPSLLSRLKTQKLASTAADQSVASSSVLAAPAVSSEAVLPMSGTDSGGGPVRVQSTFVPDAGRQPLVATGTVPSASRSVTSVPEGATRQEPNIVETARTVSPEAAKQRNEGPAAPPASSEVPQRMSQTDSGSGPAHVESTPPPDAGRQPVVTGTVPSASRPVTSVTEGATRQEPNIVETARMVSSEAAKQRSEGPAAPPASSEVPQRMSQTDSGSGPARVETTSPPDAGRQPVVTEAASPAPRVVTSATGMAEESMPFPVRVQQESERRYGTVPPREDDGLSGSAPSSAPERAGAVIDGAERFPASDASGSNARAQAAPPVERTVKRSVADPTVSVGSAPPDQSRRPTTEMSAGNAADGTEAAAHDVQDENVVPGSGVKRRRAVQRVRGKKRRDGNVG